MFADGLFDTFRPLLLLLTLVATVDMVAHRGDRHSAGAESRPTDRGSRLVESPNDALTERLTMGPAQCQSCGARVEDGRRRCPACFTTLDDGGSTQIVMFMGWLPAGVVAAIAGVAVALVEWNLLALPVVGTLLGWLATVVLFFGLLEIHNTHHFGAGLAAGLFISTYLLVGPLVACAVAVAVTVLWP